MLKWLYQSAQCFFVALILCACGAPSQAPSTLKNADALSLTDATPSVELLYWDNKNLGFGHVAIAITNEVAASDDIYISYAMGNDYAVDRAKHGKDPERLPLPRPSAAAWSEFLLWYDQSPYAHPFADDYGSDYDLLRHNCAHAALNVLRQLGYDLPIGGERPLALRPVQVYRAAAGYSALGTQE
ncbi:MAG: hypothetical protein FJ146_17565 [Deltaproteobacteria bacterium]|nr:hypothetical protein [Deltaproteobacteria bacterium]